jgi:hypothetical protein
VLFVDCRPFVSHRCLTCTIDDPHQLYHNVAVVLDKAAHINSGQPSAPAYGTNAMDLKSGKRAAVNVAHL